MSSLRMTFKEILSYIIKSNKAKFFIIYDKIFRFDIMKKYLIYLIIRSFFKIFGIFVASCVKIPKMEISVKNKLFYKLNKI